MSRFILASAALFLSGCTSGADRAAQRNTIPPKAAYDQLHKRFEKAAADEPKFVRAQADHGQVILAIRSGLIEDLAGNVASRYLDHVTVDLGRLKAHGSGELTKKTFLGKVKVGDWNVSVGLGHLVGNLRAGAPRVSLRPPDLINIELPVEVQETSGDATLHFGWDSAGIANAVCKDFELTQGIKGRVLAQQHVLSGALQLKNVGESLTESPLFPDRKIQLKLDLAPESWDVVKEALRSQDTFSKCGTFMDPDQVLGFLKTLVAQGISVHLPDSIFRTVRFPARLQESVMVNQHSVALSLKAESLRVDTAALWSSVSVEVRGAPAKP